MQALHEVVAVVPLGEAQQQVEVALEAVVELDAQAFGLGAEQGMVLAIEATEDELLREDEGDAQGQRKEGDEQPEQTFAQGHAELLQGPGMGPV
ncbi:hypothetical protein D3C78_1508530 [compost metagenome]